MSTEVTHDASEMRYTVHFEGNPVGSLSYSMQGEHVSFDSTFVNPMFRNKNLAAILVKTAISDFSAQGKKVIPACSYVERYFELHPEVSDMRAS